MARVDFYVLSHSGEQARRLFACRLAEKAYRLEHSVHIHVSDDQHARELDELLWTFRDGSFVPHHCLGEELDSPVTIGSSERVAAGDLLINLGADIPGCAQHFTRIAELVGAGEDDRQQSRERFRTYRSQGHEIETHKL